MTSTKRLARTRERCLAQIDRFLAVARDDSPVTETLTDVSGWTILQQAEHMALADLGSLRQLEGALERSAAGEPGPRQKWIGRPFLRLGWIPRGRAEAPEGVRPTKLPRSEIVARLEEVRARVEALPIDQLAEASGRASHPRFGGLTAGQWLHFMTVHHHHHLKLIDDIRRAALDDGTGAAAET